MKQARDFNPVDNMERRLFERRRFNYSNHIPERRSGRERRKEPIAEDRSGSVPRLFVVKANI
jgi:hypothetical protein